MKWIIGILLAANIVFFGLNVLMPNEQQNSAPLREINADKVQIVTARVASAPRAASASASAPMSQTAVASAITASALVASSPAPVVSAPTPTPTPVKQEAKTGNVAQTCWRWTGLTGNQSDIARSRLRALNVAATEQRVDMSAHVWVYIPPQPDLETAKHKAAQLVPLSIDDYFVVNNGSRWQNAISLGVYATRDAAERRLAELHGKGVKSAILRDRNDIPLHGSFVLKSVTSEQRDALTKASNQLRGSILQPSSCN